MMWRIKLVQGMEHLIKHVEEGPKKSRKLGRVALPKGDKVVHKSIYLLEWLFFSPAICG